MKKRLSLIALIVSIFSTMVLSPSVAYAGGSSNFYNNYGSKVTVYPCINFNTYNYSSLMCQNSSTYPDNYRFTMRCWRDALISVKGNYSSKRWFYGDVWTSTGWARAKANVWVHSSFVTKQTTVNRCY